jgi:hypothetical protein
LLEVAEAPLVPVADIVDEVVVLTRVGFWAPHGLSVVQLEAQVLSRPQAARQLTTYWVQTKYGIVSEYWEIFGWRPSAHRQP